MSDNVAFRAMLYARARHEGQVRKYSGNPYADHLAEVAGIVATVSADPEVIAAAWLHDTIEDCGVQPVEIRHVFGNNVGKYVLLLSDLEKEGNRAHRKMLSRQRLKAAPDCVKTIKLADLISNTGSIVQHDAKFAELYLAEKRLMLDEALKGGSELLWLAASEQISESLEKLARMKVAA